MEEEILVIPSGPPESYCRLCFSESNAELLLVSDISMRSSETLISVIKRYLDINISIHASQPCAVCNTCRMMLEEFDRFRKRCMRCDLILTENMSINSPPVKKQKRQSASSPVQLPTMPAPAVVEGHYQYDDMHPDKTNGTNQVFNSSNKPYQCTTCFKRFHFIGSLKRHIGESHSRVVTNDDLSYDLTTSIQATQSGALAVSLPLNAAPLEHTIDQILPEKSVLQDLLVSSKAAQVHSVLSSAVTKTSVTPFVILLERLDRNVIPAIQNLEIPLGKFYHMKQRQSRKNAINSVEETVEDEIKRIYPSLNLNKPSRVFTCDLCFRSMKSRMALTRHKMRHADIVFPCIECNRLFPDKSSLDRHMPQHTGDFPHPCDQCPLGFVRIGLLKKHQERYHGPNAQPLNLLYCSYCPRAFCAQTALSAHLFQMHPSHADNG
ncbi:zinc finger protein Xfin-like [Sabethes cyaneus]|uniref:zinc finger protein Xfin-like n=1 Tax=Sabethes cyaneus TaxID=53552 RepID=UPI00237D3F3F|nr:zinc finger protein Xfin-like [Sabethes cyaneus]